MKTSMRRLVCSVASVVCLISSFCVAESKHHSKYLMYVGTYTEEGSASKGIYAYRFDSASGEITPLGLAAQSVNPSFLAIHPNRRFVYAVNEIGNYKGEKSGAVSAFSIDEKSGKLTLLNQIASRGAGPCYISIDKSGKHVLVANYDSGSIAVFPILEDGRLGEASAFVQHTGHGTNPERQEAPHAHSIDVSPDDHFAIVDDLGLDQTLVYPFDGSKGTLNATAANIAKAAPGAGPRHFALSPSGKFGYVINEMANTVSVFGYDSAAGALTQLQAISALPKDFTGHSEAAEVVVHPSGKFLYASNRGYDSIAVFAIDQSKGTLTPIEYVPTKGASPRNFEIAPGRKLLLVGNEKSDNIVAFRIDPKTGRLTPTGKALNISQPVCIRFIAID
jgi:6-phosphogluconolactonase